MQTPIEFVSFFNNSLSGNVSSTFCNMPSLAYLDLRANNFSGEVGIYLREANSSTGCCVLLTINTNLSTKTGGHSVP